MKKHCKDRNIATCVATNIAMGIATLHVGSDRGIPTGTQSSTHTLTHTDPYPYTQGYGSSHRYKGTDPLGVYPRVCLLPPRILQP